MFRLTTVIIRQRFICQGVNFVEIRDSREQFNRFDWPSPSFSIMKHLLSKLSRCFGTTSILKIL